MIVMKMYAKMVSKIDETDSSKDHGNPNLKYGMFVSIPSPNKVGTWLMRRPRTPDN